MQGSIMSPHLSRSAIVAPMEGVALASPVLHATLLAHIRELNFDYLELLTTRAHADSPQHRVPAATLAAIRDLSTQARRLLAAAPYTLFRLHLERASLWSDASNGGARPADQRYATSTRAHAAFCDAALLYAWHVASTARVALRLTYGLNDETSKRLIGSPLWRLKRIAHDHPEVLAPRWPTNPAFWPQLAALAAAGDDARLRTALLLGHQLIAGELQEGSAAFGLSRMRARSGLRTRSA